MGDVVVHDPELARKVYLAMIKVSGKHVKGTQYYQWLRKYVYPLAEASGITIIVPGSHKKVRGYVPRAVKRGSSH